METTGMNNNATDGIGMNSGGTITGTGSSGGGGGSGLNNNISTDGLPPIMVGRERHILQKREELRFEVTFGTSSTSTLSNASGTTTFVLQKGSCELYGCELALGKTYTVAHGGIKAALFTWHGCVVDLGAIDCDGNIDGTGGVDFFAYVSHETDANVAFVNTHAQLEALRDEAAAAALASAASNTASNSIESSGNGPRVMVVGPPECGKTTLVKTLVAYGCKVGRTPIMVDLDPMDNMISVPGSLAVAPMAACGISVETYATTGLPINCNVNSNDNVTTTTSNNNNNNNNTVHPLVLYHGSTTKLHPDLYKGQIDAISASINKRLQSDEYARSSGIIVNTNGSIREHYDCLLYAAKALKISVLLIVGHDRLYSLLTRDYKKIQQQQQNDEDKTTATGDSGNNNEHDHVTIPKILKLPRSGGVVNRTDRFITSCRSRAVKRYFYGDLVADPNDPSSEDRSNNNNNKSISDGGSTTNPQVMMKPYRLVNQLTPFAIQVPFNEVKIYKLSSMALSGSVLPVGQQQTTDAIQLVEIDITNDAEEAKLLQHAVVAVCHPSAVDEYEQSGRGRDLVTAGVAGFLVVDKVVTETDTLYFLSPCAGSLPSKTMIVGDITWME